MLKKPLVDSEEVVIMDTRPFFSFTLNSFRFAIILNIIFLSYSITFAEQVVISPDKVNAPTFRTSTATCYGSDANTHINLGNNSVTGTGGQDYSHCTVGGGESNIASDSYSTVGGGDHNTANGSYSTVGGGASNIAGGDYSWAGGRNMQLAWFSENTFVWGYSPIARVIEAPNAFLIFPVGTLGKVGIGPTGPAHLLDVNGSAKFSTARIGLDTLQWGANLEVQNRINIMAGTNPNLFIGDNGSEYLQLQFKSTGNYALFFTPATYDIVFSPGGNVGIGTSTPNYKLEVDGDAAKTSGGTTWINSSDGRLKDITGDYERGLEAIASLKPVTFYYKEANPRGLPTDEENIGFVAQEVQDVFPEAISEGEDGYLDFNMHPVNVAVVNAIKELKAENEVLKTENRALREDIEQIKAALGL